MEKKYYELTEDVPNTLRDKRFRIGWESKDVFKKGTRFIISSDAKDGIRKKLSSLGGRFVYEGDPYYELLSKHLQEVPMTVMDYLHEELPQLGYAADIIRILVDEGKLQISDVANAFEKLQMEWDLEEQ